MRDAMDIGRTRRTPSQIEPAQRDVETDATVSRDRHTEAGNGSGAACLSFHAGYRCHHAGACCTAGWPIPAEPTVAAALQRRFGSQEPLFRAEPAPDGARLLALRSDGACVFYDVDGRRLCEIHRELGETQLPSACRHFPRVVLTDPRGTFVTLSHFCPTAVDLLFIDAPVSIVDAPGSLTLDGAAEGLDARQALPPLLRHGMLADLDGYDAWEQGVLDLLAAPDLDADDALAIAAAATHAVAAWSPGTRPLRDQVVDVFEQATHERRAPARPDRHALEDVALSAVNRGVDVPRILADASAVSADPMELWTAHDPIVRRYLMSKVFGNWWPYLGLDLRGVLRAIEIHAAVLKRQLGRHLAREREGRTALREAIRDTDLLLVHLADFDTLAGAIRESL
jgi:Fe-S-cluster containining protein